MLEAALLCMALNVWYEARGEPLEGQIAVAEVTMRRVQDDRWPSTACDVVYQPWQFEWTANYGSLSNTPRPSPILPSWEIAVQAVGIAQDNLESGSPVTSCADHFYNPRYASPSWEDSPLTWYDTTIGGHRFLCSDW